MAVQGRAKAEVGEGEGSDGGANNISCLIVVTLPGHCDGGCMRRQWERVALDGDPSFEVVVVVDRVQRGTVPRLRRRLDCGCKVTA